MVEEIVGGDNVRHSQEKNPACAEVDPSLVLQDRTERLRMKMGGRRTEDWELQHGNIRAKDEGLKDGWSKDRRRVE